MAEQADIYVNNQSSGDINVFRKLPDGTIDLDITISRFDEDKIYLPGPDVSLTINAPGGIDIKYSSFKVRTDIDLVVSCSRTDSNWEIKLKPNALPPEIPTSVYVTIGEDSP